MLYINASTLWVRGEGFYCDQNIFAESESKKKGKGPESICLHHKTWDESDIEFESRRLYCVFFL